MGDTVPDTDEVVMDGQDVPPPVPPLDVRWQDDAGELLTATHDSHASGQSMDERVWRSLSIAEDTTDDLLGVLSHTPDLHLQHSFSLPAEEPWSGRYRELRFSDFMPQVYLPDVPVYLSLLVLEPLPSTLHFFNQYRVVLEVRHGSFSWQVTTRLRNITSLHSKLVLFRMKLKVPVASQKLRDRRTSFREQLVNSPSQLAVKNGGGEQEARDHDKRAVKYPRKSLARMDADTPGDLQQYLRNLLLHPFYRSQRDVLNLFEVSALSFVRGLGRKLKEGLVKKRVGGYNKMYIACGLCDGCYGQYKERWLVLKETCLFFLTPSSGAVRSVLLMDQDFQVSSGFRHTGIKNGVVITSLSRRLAIMCDSDQDEKDWSTEIRRAQRLYARDFCSGANKHEAFAPQRHGALANWYVDGNRYMWDVADAVDQAREEVFITDWWLSPDIYLKRPDLTAIHWKLSEVLKRAAARGVAVYVLLYKEVEVALGLNSLYTKHALDKMHPNIKVLRHPDHGGGGTLYWAHHEKIVVVDQQLAFVSGIDLCYGRWDDYRHRLVDLGHAGMQKHEASLSPEPQDHRSSHSSIACLVMGTQVMVNTVNSVDSSTPNSDKLPSDQSPNTDALKADVSNAASGTGATGRSLSRTSDSSRGGSMNTSSCTTNSVRREEHDRQFGSRRSGGEDLEADHDNKVSRVKSSVKSTKRPQIHEVVREVMKKRLHASKDFGMRRHNDDTSSRGSSCGEATSEDELDEGGSRQTSYSDATEKKTKPLHGKPRAVSDPVKKHRSLLYRIAHSEHRKKDISFRRQKSLESLDGEGRRGNAKRKSGVKSDGDDLSAADDEGRSNDQDRHHEDRSKPEGSSSRMQAVRTRGRELVGEMKYRGTEMKNWTRRNVRLHRADSINSEADLELDEIATRKTAGRWRARVKAARAGRNKVSDSETGPALTPTHIDHAPTLYDSPSIHLWVGKDYVNWITKDLNNPDEPFTDSVERHKTPRMPWHDIGLYVEGPAARDVARHFVQRWNAVKTEKVKNNPKYPYLLPRTYDATSFRQTLSLNKQRVRCQVVRSVGEWSGGQHETERSIYNAYMDAIRESLHYIYIENQFFISNSGGGGGRGDVQNQIAAALVNRIERAYRSRSAFRVYVIMPLLPAFEGQIGTPSGTAMQFILHYTYSSICRGDQSLVGQLERRGIKDWRQYLSFCSLRTHDVLDGRLVSELIYIHSKLLIVDDRLVVAGSANINDRSFLGDRDSEVALVIEDEEFDEGRMNGASYQRGKFAGGLRRYLFSEHLGLLNNNPTSTTSFFSDTLHHSEDNESSSKKHRAFESSNNHHNSNGGGCNNVGCCPSPDERNKELSVDDIEDPVIEKFFSGVWQATARKNTAVYDKVFSCYPCDGARSFQDVERLRAAVPLAATNQAAATAALAALQGHLVEFPLRFLEAEALKPGLGTKEALLPNETWT